MLLTSEQLATYDEQGYLVVPGALPPAALASIRRELPTLFAEEGPQRVMEKDGRAVRSVYGCHRHHDLCARLVRHPSLLRAAEALVRDRVYVYQFKINAKAALVGDVWEWHQDYVFWLREDGMPACRVTNVVLCLDDVTEFNGPLTFVPGSHRHGVIDPAREADAVDAEVGQIDTYRNSPAWISNLTATLKYSLSSRTITALVERHGLVAPKAEAGSLIFFHPNIAHASGINLSPFDRLLALVTYNSVHNQPAPSGPRRPEFLVSTDVAPLEALPDGEGLEPATVSAAATLAVRK
jgi:ectoine hydroxylase